MALNVKSSIEVNTQTAEASLNRVVARFGNLAAVTEQTKNKIDILAHSFQAFSLAYQGLNKIKDVSSSFIQIADSANLLNARLKLSTDGIKNFENASKALYSIAQNTANSVDSVSNLFITLNRSFAELGYSQEKTLEVVSTFSQALKASGTASYNANIALKQLNDALAVGVLKGTDFKVLIQNAPALLGYLSDALGITAGELKTMASEGALTTEVLIKAFENMKDKVESDFKSLPLSVESASTQLKTATEDLIANINSQLGITDNLSTSLASATKFIENHKESITALSASVASFAPHLIALIATFKTAPVAVAAFNSVLATTRTIFTSGVTASLTFSSALKALKVAFMSFAPTLAIFGALELLYYWLNKNEVSADKLNNTLSLTIEQMSQMSKAQIQNSINELDDAYNKLSNEWAELNTKISKGQNLLGFKYDEKELTAFKAKMDEISKQKSKILDKTKELKEALTKTIEPVKKTASAVDETAKAFKSAMDSSAAFTKNITLLSDYQKEIKAINGEIDKLNELLKDNKLTESQRASALEQIERLNGARAQTEAKIAKASEQNAKTSINAAKQIAKSYTEALDAQISYFNAIKDHWGAANVELAKYEADLLEKVKKNLLSREQAEAMMQQKRVELEKSANDKIIKNIESTYNEQIEFFKITGDREKQLKAMHEKAHKIADEYIKKHQITAKSAIDNTRKYFIDQEMKSFKSMDDSFKENISSMTGAWDEMVGGMAKSIEQGLFDFITGKTGSLSGAFKDIGNSILQALISPMASNFSKGVAGIFSSLLGGGGNSVASIATSLGLKLENGVYRGQVDGGNVEILTDGTILSGSANLADKLGLSSGATNILSAASTLKSAASIFTSGVSGLQGSILSTTFSPFGSVSSALNGFGLNGLGTFVNDFGTGFSNVFSFASNSGSIFSNSSIFAGGMGQALGSMAGGASIGGLVGSLGDMLFGTNTKAGLGGSIGGAIGTAILPGIGTAVGSLFGSAIGGLFGSWEESDRGVQIKELVNYSSGQALSPFGFGTYVDEEKKSWFGSKERSNFELDSAGNKALNSTMKKLNTLIEDFKTNDLILPAVKITDDFKNGLNMIISTSLVSAIQNQGWLTGQATQNVFAWESAAKAQGKEVLSFMSEQISTMRTYMKALKIDTKDTFNNLKQSVKEYEKNFSTLAKDMGLGWLADINVAFIDGAALADMYSQAIKNSFDPETVANWNALIESYEAAKQAQDEYTKAIRDFSKNVYSSIISIRGAYGLNTDRLSVESVKASFYMLARDLNLITGSIEEFSQNLRDTSILDMAGFLSYDTQNRSELLGYAAQYAQLGSKALENLKNSIQGYIDEIGSINEQIAALELAKKQDELNLSKEHYTALISLYKEQKKFVDRLKGLANSLRMDVWGANEISAYYKSTLSQAKYDYANGIYDSEAVNNLSAVAKQHAQNLKATATSAEQYRFEVLQMANEIENIVPKDEVQTIMEGLELANKELDKINAKLKELIDSTQKSKDEQIAALEASKQEITKQTAELLKSNAELFGELGGDFESGFGELASAFELVASSIDKSFKGLAEQLKTTAKEANKDSSYYSPDLSWDELSSTINSYYQEYFGRNAEYKGLNFWYQAVASGLHSLSAIERQILDVGANITNENLTDEAYERLRQLGIHKFADGGIVTGPTNALIGEAGYPEAVIPLKDGAGLKIDTSGIFERLENRMLTMEQKLKMVLEKIEKNTNELNRTLSGVTDGDVLYINGKVKVS